MNTKEQLFWVAMAVIAYFAIRTFSPKIAGVALAALVVGGIVMIGPQLSKIGQTKFTTP